MYQLLSEFCRRHRQIALAQLAEHKIGARHVAVVDGSDLQRPAFAVERADLVWNEITLSWRTRLRRNSNEFDSATTLNRSRLRLDLDPRDLHFARATSGHIQELIVDGRSIVQNGHVTGIDLPVMGGELLARFRSGMSQNAVLASALPHLEKCIADHFDPDAPCC